MNPITRPTARYLMCMALLSSATALYADLGSARITAALPDATRPETRIRLISLDFPGAPPQEITIEAGAVLHLDLEEGEYKVFAIHRNGWTKGEKTFTVQAGENTWVELRLPRHRYGLTSGASIFGSSNDNLRFVNGLEERTDVVNGASTTTRIFSDALFENLVNRHSWDIDGAGASLQYTPTWTTFETEERQRFNPKLSISLGEAEADLRFDSTTVAGQSNRFEGSGFYWGAGVDLEITIGKLDSGFYGGIGVWREELQDVTTVRNPPIRSIASVIERDTLGYRAYWVDCLFGYRRPRFNLWAGRRTRTVNVDLRGHIEADFTQSLGVPVTSTIDFRNAFEQKADELLAGIEINFSRLQASLEGSGSSGFYTTRASVKYRF